MKKMIFGVLAVIACAFLSVSCSDLFKPQTPSGEIPENTMFYTNVQGLSFYFVDGEGNELVSLTERSTWPLAAPEQLSAEKRATAVEHCSQTARSDGRVYYIYNDNCNAICEDYETKRWGFTTYFWGKTRLPEYTTYVYRPDGGLDSIRVQYKYLSSDEGTLSSSLGWAVNVESVKYNGVEVFNGNENGKVFIQKPSQGDVVVKVGRL